MRFYQDIPLARLEAGSWLWIIAAAAMLAAIFALDAMTPRGYAGGTLYVLAVMVAALSMRVRLVVGIAASASLLTVVGWFLSPVGFEPVYVLLNRSISILAQMITLSVAVIAIVYARRIARHRHVLGLAGGVAQIGGWQYAPESGDLVWTSQAADIFGVREPEPQHGLLPSIFGVHGSRERLTELLDRCINGGESFDEEMRIETEDGQSRWVRIVGRRAETETDGPSITGAIQDITDQKRIELRLRASEERFRLAAQAVTDVVWDWDLAADTVWWSEGMRTVFGYPDTGRAHAPDAWTARIHPEDRARVVAGIEAAIEGGALEWSDEHRFLRAGGETAQVMDRGFIVRNEAGEPTRMVGSMDDVTELRMLESKLQQAERLEAVGQLTGGVAHDFNNLLTVMLGNAEILEQALKDDESLGELARVTRRAAEQGAELTKHLLAFARRQSLEPSPTDINDLVRQMQPLLARTLGEQIGVELILDPETGPALVDGPQLETAILNLCINARDAMPEGGTVTIETRSATLSGDFPDGAGEAEPGEYVMVSVTDAGVGMDADTAARAFEPFFTTKETGKGSGLGLSMIYGFARQSGGLARLYLEPGTGTTVRLYLPPAGARAEPADEPAADGGTLHGDETVLLVEDNELVLDHLRGQLGALGYRVIAARGGAEAIGIIESGRPLDLLLTDIVMPGEINGRELAARARRARPELPVLLMTGYSEVVASRLEQPDRGMDLINKPFRQSDLALKVRRLLDAAAGAETNGP